jgi:glucose/arabinose dehydrogenase
MRSRTCSVLIALHVFGCSSSESSNAAAKSDASTTPATKTDAAVSGDSGPRVDRDAGASSGGRGGTGGQGGKGGSNPSNASDAGGEPGTPKPTCVGTKPLDAYVADPKLCAYVFAEDLGSARQLAFAPNGDLFVNNQRVTVLWDEDGDGYSSASERAVFGEAQGLNHGIAFSPDNKFVYVSSGTTVYRYAYKSGQRATEDGARQTVISGIPTGGHSTRTLAFDSKGRLYVSIGSAGNVDSKPADIELRSQIRRYQLPETLPQGGITYPGDGELIASGMRNEAGIFIDAQDRLWGVENGRDNLSDENLGGDIHNDNPGEEINLVDGQGSKFYGYPSCFSEHTVNGGMGKGSQWADESVSGDLRKTDAFCSDPAEVHPPAFVMPAHWAPLGLIMYSGRSLPYAGELIIGAHGSWNRSPATGRVVARAKVQGTTVSDLQVILGQKDSSGELQQGSWNVRPVDVRQGPDDAVYISDDQGGRIIKLGYRAGG